MQALQAFLSPALATTCVRAAPGLAAACLRRHISSSTVQRKLVTDNRIDERQFTEIQRDFLDPAEFYSALLARKINFFAGVPDSLLKDFCAYVTDHTPSSRHIITANEGNAVAVAAGHYLGTGKPALVYLQNSGLGNIINPILSLADPEVYSIPMLLLIGWRGEPGKKDEPQHLVQGMATPSILATLNVPFQVLPDFQEGAEKVLDNARSYMASNCGPYAILVRRQTFLPYKLPPESPKFEHNRESAMKLVIDGLGPTDCVVSTTGMLSRELFEHRVARGEGHARDFLTVGSMGHANSIALGIALAKPGRQVYCLDGDGALEMHMGSLATIAQHSPHNLKHIVINNGAHDSVGGQPTGALKEGFDIPGIAKNCRYSHVARARTTAEIIEELERLRTAEGPALLEIQVNKGGRKDLGRPTRSPQENKDDFMDFLADD